MTLVYRCPKSQQIKPLHDLGPGSYNITQKKPDQLQKPQKSSVFASSTERDAFEIKKYQKQLKELQKLKKSKLQQNPPQQTTQGQNQSASILNPKKSIDCSHVFNSKVSRFDNIMQRKLQMQEKSKQLMLMEQFQKLLLKQNNSSNKGKLLKIKDKLQKQKQLDQKQQVFPSIPNWENSFGYRYDPDSKKWISNQNPSLMFALLDRQRQQKKHNFALGPGYYLSKNIRKQSKPSLHQQKTKTQSFDSKDLLGSIIYPKIKPETPIHGSIEENQNKLKLRIKLFGKGPIDKMEQVKNNRKVFSQVDLNVGGKNKKQALLRSQLYKNFKQYILKDQQEHPQTYLQQIQTIKNQSKLTKLLPKETKQNQSVPKHFLTKSQRFSIKDQNNRTDKKCQKIEQSSSQDLKDSIEQNSSMLQKSHNCKQPYSLGSDRFKEPRPQNLGPGKYYTQNSPQKKPTPSLNLKQERFTHNKKKSELPAPGDYNVEKNLAKKQNTLSDAFTYYKKANQQQMREKFKREDSMQSLYQNWGRQMNYIAKLQHNSRPQQTQDVVKSNSLKPHQKAETKNTVSLVKVKKQLQRQMEQFGDVSTFPKPVQQSHQRQNSHFTNQRIASTVDARSRVQSQKPSKSPSPHKIYPKIKKHLYEYKQLESENKQELMGPGKYDTTKQLIKKTFNVTYT